MHDELVYGLRLKFIALVAILSTYSCKVTKKCKGTLSDISGIIHATLQKQIPKVTLWNLMTEAVLMYTKFQIWKYF